MTTTPVIDWDRINKRRLDPVARTLKLIVSDALPLFFLTYNRSYKPVHHVVRDEVRFWGMDYSPNNIAKDWAEKIATKAPLLWREELGSASSSHKSLVAIVTDLLDPRSTLCKDLQIGTASGVDDREAQRRFLSEAAGHILSSQGLSFEETHTQKVLDFAFTNINPNPRRYNKRENIISVSHYIAQDGYITPPNLHIYIAEYLYAWPRDVQNPPSGFAFLFFPLRGLGQWRATADWISPMEAIIQWRREIIEKSTTKPLLTAVEELYSVGLIDVFILALEEALSTSAEVQERMVRAASAFSQLWIAQNVLFYRNGLPVLCLSGEPDKASQESYAYISGLGIPLVNRSSLLSIDPQIDSITLDLEKLDGGYLLRQTLGFDLVVYERCPRLNIQHEQTAIWELQLKEKLERIAAAGIREQNLQTHGFTHELMNTLRRRSRYPELYNKVLRSQEVHRQELLYLFTVLDDLYRFTDVIRSQTKYEDKQRDIRDQASRLSEFRLEVFAHSWRAAFQDAIKRLLLGLDRQQKAAVIFHAEKCSGQPPCSCKLIPQAELSVRTPVFPPFNEKISSLFLVALHEPLGNAVDYLLRRFKSRANNLQRDKSFFSDVDIWFGVVPQGQDRYYEIRVGNRLRKGETISGLTDGVRRSDGLFACYLFRDSDGHVRRLVEFCEIPDVAPDYYCVAVRFRPHLVFMNVG